MKELEKKADAQWEGFAGIKDSGGVPTDKARRAAVDGALAAVTTWLRHDDGLRERVAAVGQSLRRKPPRDEHRGSGGRGSRRRSRTPQEEREFVQTHIIPRLVEEFGRPRVAEFQARAVETHFWCELLAQTAQALDECKGQYDRAKQFVVDTLTSEKVPHPPLWARLLPRRGGRVMCGLGCRFSGTRWSGLGRSRRVSCAP